MFIRPHSVKGEIGLFKVSTNTRVEAWHIARAKGGLGGVALRCAAVLSPLGKSPTFLADLEQLVVIEANLRTPSPTLSAFIVRATQPVELTPAPGVEPPLTSSGSIDQISA